MELDRESIARSDFPQARRGYDPDAVDRHLASVAESAEELRAELDEATATRQTLSGAAAEQIRLIVQAAEQSAAAIETKARETADRQASEAEARARELVGMSRSRVDGLVTRVDEATDVVLQRLDRLESELTTLRDGARSLSTAIDGLEGRSAPLRRQVEEMRTGVHELRDDPDAALAGSGAPAVGATEPEPLRAEEPAPEPFRPKPSAHDEAGTLSDDAGAPSADRPSRSRRSRRRRNGAPSTPPPRAADEEIAPEATPEPSILPEDELEDDVGLAEEEPIEGELDLDREEELRAAELSEGADARPGGGDDEEGARLVALNMALNGVPREEADRYLAENFALRNRGHVLDDVYTRVGDT